MRDRIRNILFETTVFQDRPNINDNFWKWFGDSKVVDDNGDPLVMYRGLRTRYIAGKDVTWCSESANVASSYSGNGEGSHVMPIYASAKNPYYIDQGIDMEDFLDRENINSIVSGAFLRDSEKKKQFRKIFSEYDIVYEAINDKQFLKAVEEEYDAIVTIQRGAVAYCVFRISQIKSVYNQGTWNPNNSDIMK